MTTPTEMPRTATLITGLTTEAPRTTMARPSPGSDELTVKSARLFDKTLFDKMEV